MGRDVRFGAHPTQEAGALDEAWLAELNEWLGWIAERLIRDIEMIVGNEEWFNNYVSFEDESCETLYERIHMRRKYVNILIENILTSD